jgi:hypothetical protein
LIDEKRILDNLRTFSFPRLSGTEHEKRSFEIAKKKIEKLNLVPRVQKFSFSTFYSRIYPKLTLILLFWLLIVFFLNFQVFFTFINTIIILLSLLILVKITRNPEDITFGKIYSSQNVFIKIRSNNREESVNDKNILLFSHLDSKGQTFSVKIRIFLYYIWIFSFTFSLAANILKTYFFLENIFIFYFIGIILLSINGVTALLLLLNRTNNISKGAIDNASGIAIVMELLNYFKIPKNRLQHYNLWFVFTGAEETGTMGIRNFYRIIKNFDKDQSYIINFDCISRQIELYNHGLIKGQHQRSLNYIQENKDLMTVVKTKKIYLGSYSDGLFLHNKNFQGLGHADKTSYNYVHSKEDDIDKIDVLFLKKLCKFIIILLNENDDQIIE